MLEPPHWGSSNKYIQSVFQSNNKENMYTPACIPQFYYIKVGYRGHIYMSMLS